MQRKSGRLQRLGTQAKKDENGIRNTAKEHGKTESSTKKHVPSAVKYFIRQLTGQPIRPSAQENVYTDTTPKQKSIGKKERVRYAELSLRLKSQKSKDTALTGAQVKRAARSERGSALFVGKRLLARQAKIKKLVPVNADTLQERGTATVYNLEVEDCHEYFANGVLVHNCVWALTELMLPKKGKLRVEI
jgi:intein/homing endonuclease